MAAGLYRQLYLFCSDLPGSHEGVQYNLSLEAEPPLERIHRLLLASYGRPGPWVLFDPVSQLVMALIGTRTVTTTSKRVFVALVRRYGSWAEVSGRPPAELRALLVPVTYADVKAERLPAALRAIARQCGALDLDFLGAWPEEPALHWLERLPGVGRKVSAATLNFSLLRRRVLVVDLHHLRVVQRLGLVPRNAALAQVYHMLMRGLPDRWTAADLDDHHMLIMHHAQTVCRVLAPRCGACVLAALCPTAARGRQPRHDQGPRSRLVEQPRSSRNLPCRPESDQRTIRN
jgi:endonuclease-3